MTAQQILNWIQPQFDCEKYSIGEPDANSQQELCVIGTQPKKAVTTIGSKGYISESGKVLLRWGTNYSVSESAARELHDLLRFASIENGKLWLQSINSAPTPLGKDDSGVYQWTVEFDILGS